MSLLLLGLALFIGVHSVRIFAPGWRDAQIAARGEGMWQGLYSGVAIISFAILVALLWNAVALAVPFAVPCIPISL